MIADKTPSKTPRFRVAAVLIARNEAPRIARAIQSIYPWVDEVLVLDTGSTDGTQQVAMRAGARVHEHPWEDDFSAARNRALDLAGADWHVMLDADEWLEEGGAVLASLRERTPDFVGSLAVASAQGPSLPVVPSLLSRVLPGAVRYHGRIHEQPAHSLPVLPLAVRLGHSGYEPDARAAKAGRNDRLLAAAVAEHPEDAYLWYQTGKNHDVYERYAQAAQAFDRAEALLGDHTAPPGWLHDLTVRRLHALKRCGLHAEAMRHAEAGLSRWSNSPDFFFALGDLLLDWAAEQPAQAPTLLPLIENAWQRCLIVGEQPQLEGAVPGRGSHLAAHNLALLYDTLGRPDEAAHYHLLAGNRTAATAP